MHIYKYLKKLSFFSFFMGITVTNLLYTQEQPSFFSEQSTSHENSLNRLLCHAVNDFEGDFTQIKELLNQGADYNGIGYQETPLMWQ